MADTDIRRRLDAIRADANEALAKVAAAHGLQTLALGRATYDPKALRFTFKLDGLWHGGKTREAQQYEELARYYEPGLPALGSVLREPRHGCITITGANAGSKVIARAADDGKEYLYPAAAIARAAQQQGFPPLFSKASAYDYEKAGA